MVQFEEIAQFGSDIMFAAHFFFQKRQKKHIKSNFTIAENRRFEENSNNFE